MSTLTIAGPELTPATMHVAGVQSPVRARVLSTARCTASSKASGVVRHIAFDIRGTPLAGTFVAGQSFGVIPPGVDGAGNAHRLRLYSLASPRQGEDGAGCVVATTVKRLIDEHWETHKLFLGVASNYLCDLHPGDEVLLTGPAGKRFVLPLRPQEHDYVFVATGTGIAPFRGMLRELELSAPASRVVLVMGSPYATDLLYHDELRELSRRLPGFTYVTALSRERQEDGAAPMYVHDRLATACPQAWDVLSTPRGLLYMCGIAGMELGVLRALHAKLPQDALEQYLALDQVARDNPKAWTRAMLHKQVKPTRRIFMEVY